MNVIPTNRAFERVRVAWLATHWYVDVDTACRVARQEQCQRVLFTPRGVLTCNFDDAGIVDVLRRLDAPPDDGDARDELGELDDLLTDYLMLSRQYPNANFIYTRRRLRRLR